MMEETKTEIHLDATEQALAQFEKDQQEFANHWVWKELGTTPEQFFQATQQYVKQLNLPQAQWQETYEKVKAESKIRSTEKRQAYRPMNLKMISSIRV